MTTTYKVNTDLAKPTEDGVYRVGVTATITRYIDIKAPSQEAANAEAERLYHEEGPNQYDWEEDAEEFESVFDADI
mgnify:FL=1